MNRGTMRGFATTIGDYQPNPQGGSWGGNRGRLQLDEIRMLGVADHQGYWLNNGNSGGARLFNTNPNAQVGNVAFPGDTGMVVNVGSGTMQIQGAPAPFSAAYNISGRYRVSTSAGSIVAGFESNAISDNVNGIGQTLMGLTTVIGVNMYVANGAACTMPTVNDFESAMLLSSFNSGTLTGTQVQNHHAGIGVGAGVTLTNRVAYSVDDAVSVGGSNFTTAGSGTLTNQFGLDIPLMTFAATLNTAIRIGRGGQTLTAVPPSNGQIDVYTGTTTMNVANGTLPPVVNLGGTFVFSQAPSSFGFLTCFKVGPTLTTTTASQTWSSVFGMLYGPTFNSNGVTTTSIGTQIGYAYAPTTSITSGGVISGGGMVGAQVAGTIGTGTTIGLYQGFLVGAPTITGTLTTWVGVDISAVTGAGTNIGIRNASSLRQQGAVIATNNVVTVTSNAGTVAVTNYLSTFTNSSAATMAITMAVTGAVDGQKAIVRIYDFSAVTETIGWTNTENSGAVAPTTSNGSTTLPLTVGFIFNGSTSKWRCVAVA